MIAVTLYLAAIVLANVTAAMFGPSWTIVNAFLFIGFDLTMRDRLHEKWRGDPWRMGALIAAGGVLSYIVNRDAGQIALASFAAFAAAGLVDWFVYQRLRDRKFVVRANGSNVASALVDSLVFPTVAFGSFLPLVVLGQWLAKVFGGAVWVWVIDRAGLSRENTQT